MIWRNLKDVQRATRLEFTKPVAAKHNFVQLPDGRWTRVLGRPIACAKRVRGRVYHLSEACFLEVLRK